MFDTKTTARVLIGIQARSTSSRFPNKANALIGQKTVTQHVLDQCFDSATHVQKGANIKGANIECFVALVVPKGDPLEAEYIGKVPVFTGSEDDVLSRYAAAMAELKPDFLVRITGDCPLIPSYVISTTIRRSVTGNLDYCSNVDEESRTDIDGWDCELISSKAFQYLLDNAKDPKDREHVTTYLRRNKPAWARFGSVIGHVDLSSIKLSVDTQEDLEAVRKMYEQIQTKINNARRADRIVFRL